MKTALGFKPGLVTLADVHPHREISALFAAAADSSRSFVRSLANIKNGSVQPAAITARLD
jgi:hypothetical protein